MEPFIVDGVYNIPWFVVAAAPAVVFFVYQMYLYGKKYDPRNNSFSPIGDFIATFVGMASLAAWLMGVNMVIVMAIIQAPFFTFGISLVIVSAVVAYKLGLKNARQ